MASDVVTLYGAKQREFSFQGAIESRWWLRGRVRGDIHEDKFLLQYFAQVHLLLLVSNSFALHPYVGISVIT